MADRTVDLEQPITVRFRWTADELCQGYRYHFRHICRPTIRFGLHVIFALISWGGALGCMQERGWSLTLPIGSLCVGVYWFAIRGFDFRWGIRRKFAKRPDKDTEVEWQISPTKITIRGSLAYTECSWGAFTKVLRTPRGLMFYPINEIFHWLPRHAFASDAEFESVTQLAMAKVPRFYHVR
jgi:hypothetical protein